ncbi:MAG: hypothetical protein AB7S80_01700 [Rhizobiaceae bacterium]
MIVILAAAAPTAAFAHASDRGFVLLLPTGYYLLGGALAVIASFLALALLPRWSPRRLGLLGAAPPDALRVVTSCLAFAGFAALVSAGFAGSRDPLSNPLPLTIWTLLWIGLTLVQGLAGNLWHWISPWYGPARLMALATGGRRLRLPEWLGWWPAVILFFGFAWFELIDPAPDDPHRLATVSAIYFAGNLIAMAVFGYEPWARRGECLSAFFNLLARFAILGRDADGRLSLSWPGARIADVPPLPLSGVLFLLLALSSVSFDGFSRTFVWMAANGINPLEFPGRTAMMATNSLGLAGAFVALSALFLICVLLGERLAGNRSPLAAAGLLVWSLVPIALAYHFSHYLTALLVNGQYALVALSDPFARGWNLFGTADWQVTPGMIVGADSAWLLWNAQAGAIILGHVLAVLVAHAQAQRLHADRRAVALSQLPLTALMVGYTVFGLWLLSTPTAA